jgi:hypothetical protein
MKMIAMLFLLSTNHPIYLESSKPIIHAHSFNLSGFEKKSDHSKKEKSSSLALESALYAYSCVESFNTFPQTHFITVIDYSLPSNIPRLFVYEIETKKIILNVNVAHGRASGIQYAQSFSNEPSSFKSSLGFFRIGSIYTGKHGTSVRLEGLEPGINDNALSRGIVIHAADYVSDSFIRSQGRAGRSLGCPAVSTKDMTQLLPLLKQTNCLFIYAPHSDYFQRSLLFR